MQVTNATSHTPLSKCQPTEVVASICYGKESSVATYNSIYLFLKVFRDTPWEKPKLFHISSTLHSSNGASSSTLYYEASTH